MKHLLLLAIATVILAGCEPAEVANKGSDPAASVVKAATDQNKSDLPSVEQPLTGDFSLRILSWNVESHGADPNVIAAELKAMTGYDIVALTEVLPEASEQFRLAVGTDFESITSKSGLDDRMMLIFNPKNLELVRKFELNRINFKSRYRSPLVAHFRDTLSGNEVLVMVNHLARGSEKVRQILSLIHI